MKKITILSTLACLSIMFFSPLIEARGGGRGGGGGGRGGGGGGRGGGMNRSPSMSRAVSNAPSRGNMQKPNRSQVNDRINQTPRNVQDFTRSSNNINRNQLNNVIQDRTQKDISRNNISDGIRSNIANHYPNKGDWFNKDFMNRHDYHPNYWLGDGNAWKVATWAAVMNWNNWGWGEPYWYDYSGYDNEDYVYADQVQEITSPTAEPSQSSEWMSLGVFTVTSETGTDIAPNIYMQLALDKSGNIDGTIYNSTTDATYPLEGNVNKENQRAAWMMSNSENSPIFETGIYNLTKDQTPARVIYADGSTKNVLLVRLKQPAS